MYMGLYTKIIEPLIVGLLSLIALALVLLYVDPTNTSIVYILMPVVLVWVGVFCMLQVFGLLFFRRRNTLFVTFSAVLTSASVLLMLLSGLGQLTVRDVVLTILLTTIASFYIYRTWSSDV